MGIIQQIIDAILTALGLKKEAPKLPAPGSQVTARDKERIKAQSVSGLEDVQGAENIKVHGTGAGSKILESRDGADLVEDDGVAQWVGRVNDRVPRAQWADEWGPIRHGSKREALEDFTYHEMVFDHTRATDPRLAERKLQELGYRDAGHWYKVRATVVARHATPTGPNAGDGVLQDQDFIDAGLKASARKYEEERKAEIAKNPGLLAPIEGVTVEQYAEIAARQAQGGDQASLVAHLGRLGLDLATWERASAGWNDRMSKDTTGTITSIYGKAFMGAGQGQYGTTAQQVSTAAYTGVAASGAEPISFDRNCEIAGAMQAWSETGQDVNAMLASTFQMNAMDYSAASTWWFTQLTADMKRFDAYNKKVEEYKKKYLGGAAKAGSDIAF